MVKAQISVHAWCRHSDVFSHQQKWLSLPPPHLPIFIIFVFRHHFWCFPFLYIKNTKHNSEKNSIGLSCFCHDSKTFFCSFSCQHLLFFVAFFPILLQSLTYWQSIQYFTTEQDWKITFDLSNQIKARILYPIREVKWKLTGRSNTTSLWCEGSCPTWAVH